MNIALIIQAKTRRESNAIHRKSIHPFVLTSLYIAMSKQSLGLAIAERHNGPFPSPCPLPRLTAAAVGKLTELLILAGG
jgi:hypothetical protein